MNRMRTFAIRWTCVAVAMAGLFAVVGRMDAQTPAPDAKSAAKPTPADEMGEFAPQPAPPLPAGMTGSSTSDPRYTLKPGMYDAGEAAMGMKHIDFLKKPEAFRLDATSPDDPKVNKALMQMGVGDISKMPKPLKPVLAQLAYANSDFAFEKNYLFQGNFYGVNIYDISNPAKTALLTSLCARVDRAMCQCMGICFLCR